MNDQNRYEEVPQKENKFVKALKTLGSYFKFVFIDFINSFKYNNMKLAAILFAMPGLLLGFFMFAHVPTIRHIQVSYERDVEGSAAKITAVENGETDYKLTLEKYTVNGKEYPNIVLELTDYDLEKQDIYPVDGTTTDSSLTQIKTLKISSFTQVYDLDDDGNKTYKDQFNIAFDFEEDIDKVSEFRKIDSFRIFIYEVQNSKNYYTGDYITIPANNTEDGVFTYVPYSKLGSDASYMMVVKAIPKNGVNSYTSALSPAFINASISENGSEYNADNYSYVRYYGNYKVTSYDGNAVEKDSDLDKFTVSVESDGTIYYKDGAANNENKAQLYGSGLELSSKVREVIHIIPFDFSGIAIFFLTLFGFLNVFLSLELSKKKNFGTVIKCTLTTAAILLLSFAYFYAIFATEAALKLPEGRGLKLANITTIIDSNAVVSMIAVGLAALFSVAGLILAFINYDRTYEKVDR